MSVERVEAVGDAGRTHRCMNCGWHGPEPPDGQCPDCPQAIPKGAGRNRPCACGSGKKAKKCCAR